MLEAHLQPATELCLEPWLQQAVDNRVVTWEEAWAVQDMRLTHPPDQEFWPYPPHLWPVAERLHLWEWPVVQDHLM